MSIYLAWSLYKLFGVLLIIVLAAGLVLWLGKSQPRIEGYNRAVAIAAVVAVVLTLLAAFNIGDRQQHLTRSHSNASFDEVVPAYVPPPPDHLKAAREALDKSVLELNNTIKERKQ